MKRAIFLLGVLTVFSLLMYTDAIAVEISDLKITGVENTSASDRKIFTFTFKSSHSPEDVVMNCRGTLAVPRGVPKARIFEYSWKKGELEITAKAEGGVYEITTKRHLTIGDPGSNITVDVEVWVIAGGEQSNKLKISDIGSSLK